MCGLAGILSSTDRPVDEELLVRMRDAMVHRGPDGAGLWLAPDKKIGLGHRRLSIIDLSAAASQPMSNEDGTLWLVYNGEIYNHAEIRKELEKKGTHRWKTDHSDTEVILHAFEEWGIDCVKRFRGMFAIALWDARNSALWLIRDRIGIKPLYYCFHGERLYFASEIKAILANPEIPRRIDEEALFHYLSFLVTPAPATMFAKIKKLSAGEAMRVDKAGRVTMIKYWDVLDSAEPQSRLSEGEIAERLLHELRQAVKLRKISDVPVGIFLSGGIDSSTNAKLFSEDSSLPIKTFSIGYQGDNKTCQNETGYARLVADQLGADHHEKLLCVDDLLDFMPKMVYHQDEPIADPVCIPLYYVSKLARDNGVIVAQVGEGSDELFCGYPKWRRLLAIQQFNDRVPGAKMADWLGMMLFDRLGKRNHYYSEILSRAARGFPVFWGGAEGLTKVDKDCLLSERMRAKFHGFTSYEAIRPIRDRFLAKPGEKSVLNWMTYLDLNLRLPELLLMRVDKMSMIDSVECRVPFLDHKFVEYAMSIPAEMKVKHGELKHILKRAVKGLIPDEIIYRQKQGFSVPIRDWVLEKLGEELKTSLLTFCRGTDLLDEKGIKGYLERREVWKLWPLFNLALWHKQYIEGEIK